MNGKMTKYAAGFVLSACATTLVLAGGLLISGTGALADEGLAGFGNIASPREKPAAPKKKIAARKKVKTPAEPWGPVPTDKLSLVNIAPVLLPYFNNGPVFGVPGTVLGDFWHRTQVTGDWGGVRTELARHGLFIDVYTTSTFQDVTSGGLKTGDFLCRTSRHRSI